MFKLDNVKIVFSLFLLTFSFALVAQDADSQTDDEDANNEENIEEVVTTGSRIARDPLTSAQPLTIISGDEILQRGYTNAAQSVFDVPGVRITEDGTGNQGSLGAGQQVASNFGLGSDRTLTLVNSRRFVGSQAPVSSSAGSGLAVDINNIPTALIDRIEIVPVGGAAVYGADAIAGVINYVLKDDFEGAELRLNRHAYSNITQDNFVEFTVGGNFDNGRGNVVFNMLVEDGDDVYGHQLNSRYRNCTNGFWNPNPQDQGQRIYYTEGSTYEVEVEPTRNPEGQDENGYLSYGTAGSSMCQYLVSNLVEGLASGPYGENEVGGIFQGPYGEVSSLWTDDQGNPRWYTFDGPGNLVEFFPGIPQADNYWWTYGPCIYKNGLTYDAASDSYSGECDPERPLWSNRDNAADRASFHRKNFSAFVKYDLTDNAQMYLDVYSNRLESQENGSTSSAHYSDYWFGYVNSDYEDAGGTNQFSPLGAIPITCDHPFLTASSAAVCNQAGHVIAEDANGDDVLGFYINKLHHDLMPTGSGENIYNESTVDFISLGVTGTFDVQGKTYSYEVGMGNGRTRIISTNPEPIGARWFAAMDVGMNPNGTTQTSLAVADLTAAQLDIYENGQAADTTAGTAAIAAGDLTVFYTAAQLAAYATAAAADDFADCRFNYDPNYVIPGVTIGTSGYGDVVGGGIGLGTPGDCIPYNVMGANNPQNEASKEYFIAYENEGAELTQESIYLNLSGELVDLPAGPVEFVVGYDEREETGRFDVNMLNYFGLTLNSSPQKSAYGEMQINSSYVEFAVPLAKDMPMMEDVRMDIGYRHIDNSNTIRSRDYDVSAISLFWKVNDELAFRTSEQTTTKSPNVADLYGPLNPSYQQADDPCDADYIATGDNPQNRAANCAADGIVQPFQSIVSGATAPGFNGGNINLRDERADTFSFGFVYTPAIERGDLSITVDKVVIDLYDSVENFNLEDNMVACYDATVFPNDYCDTFTRGTIGGNPNQIVTFSVGRNNAGIIEFETTILNMLYANSLGDFGDYSINARLYHQDKRNEADSGDIADLVDKTGWASEPENVYDITFGLQTGNLFTYWKVDGQTGGWINKNNTDSRADYYIGANGTAIHKYGGYWTDTLGMVYTPNDQTTLTLRIDNPLDHDGSESRYDTERGLIFQGTNINAGLVYKF